jgi:hypothetical protein
LTIVAAACALLCWRGIFSINGQDLIFHYLLLGAFVLTHLFFLIGCWFTWEIWREERYDRREREGRCCRCGYDLRASIGNNCSECGFPIVQRNRTAETDG